MTQRQGGSSGPFRSSQEIVSFADRSSSAVKPIDPAAEDGLTSVSPEERIAAAESFAKSGHFHLPPGVPSAEDLAKALAQPGDARIPLRLIRAYDSEQDETVRTEIFRALLGMHMDLRERHELAAVRGLELDTVDQATFLLLHKELTRMKEEHDAARRQ